jgi:CRP-like cAMP-binding protein
MVSYLRGAQDRRKPRQGHSCDRALRQVLRQKARATLPKPQNLILGALPDRERRRLLESAELIDAPQRHVFSMPPDRFKYGYFPESGMVSELIRLANGRAVDVSPLGIEGFLGLPILLSNGATTHESVMQITGSVWRVRAVEALRLFEECEVFHKLIHRYVHARYVQASQCCACNLMHSVNQRLARWLLIALHHARTDTFQITQEYLSEMIGANRSTVTLLMGDFQRAALLEYRRGIVRIKEREKLTEAACECNAVVTWAFNQII